MLMTNNDTHVTVCMCHKEGENSGREGMHGVCSDRGPGVPVSHPYATFDLRDLLQNGLRRHVMCTTAIP